MRKRAQRRSTIEETVQTTRAIKPIKKKTIIKKNQWIAISLVGIFFMVLLLNSYFNVVSEVAINPDGESVSEKFYLSGPDPYYNMRLVNQTLATGQYPFYVSGETDPLLNYPLGRSGGGRAPLMNMIAIGFSGLLSPFMNDIDAIGYSMQFVPALFGALLIFPVYFIGKTLFGRKEGIVAAMLVAIIPIHIGSGHGSAYALFDHDSLNLLLFFLTFLFLIKSIKEKESKKSMLYALLAGIPLAGLSMVWVEAQFLYVVIGIYVIIQILVDVFKSKIDRNIIRNLVIILFTGYLVSLPVKLAGAGRFAPDITLFLGLGVALFGLVAILLEKKKIPWVISLPFFFCGGAGLYILLIPTIFNSLKEAVPFLSPLTKLSVILHGSGIYGNKVSGTIAEASTYNISRSVMSYGPAIYWLAWFGLIFMMYLYFTQKGRRDYLFIISLFIIDIWLASTAGRFLNDMVPLIAILGGWITWFAISKIDYKQMFRNIRNAGGGLRGLRKGIKIYHIVGVLFVALIVIMPNAFLALDAAVPGAATKNGTSNMKVDYFGEDHSGAFGSSSYKEQYWVDAFAWLNDQDTEIEMPGERPAFISWWDYGFYGVAVGGHPVVADNFQDGIPPAANFHTAKSEIGAVGVWIVRLLQGHIKENNGKISTDVVDKLKNHLGENNTNDVVRWIENAAESPSYHTPIGEEYDEELSKQHIVGEQYADNAAYHDITNLFNDTLDDEGITVLYHDVQEATGLSIRYYGVEGYDEQIFNIFGFLADKSLILLGASEDEFTEILFNGKTYYAGSPEVEKEYIDEPLQTYLDLSDDKKRRTQVESTPQSRKDAYYETMFYRTYAGVPPQDNQMSAQQLPCYGMRHFYAEYISPYPYYGSGRSAVVIAKYYEGAFINGSLSCNNTPLQFAQAVIFDKYGIPHDNMMTDENGNFSLLVPAGDITLQFSYANDVILEEIIFNDANNSLFSPITDDEAMRLTDYVREINVTINLSTIEGYVYEDNDNNGSYEPGIDTPLSGVTISVSDEYFGKNPESVTTDEDGYYTVRDLYPSRFTITAGENGFEIHSESVSIGPGTHSYNISKPKLGGIKGTIFKDSDDSGLYGPGEETGNVKVDLLYSKDNNIVGTTITDETGEYEFSLMVPGEYILNASVTNSATGYYDYLTVETIEIEANKTTTFNVSLDYAPIILSGYTKHVAENIGDIKIDFSPDGAVANNTAEQASSTSLEDGSYVADLKPGQYNISIDGTSGEYEAAYSYSGQITLAVGEGVKTLDLLMTKKTVTVSGSTTYNSANIDNISIILVPDSETENNTAEYASAMSDENGAYIVELVPGTYDITVDHEVNESGQDVIYAFTGLLEVTEADVAITFDIAMMREEKD